MSLVKLQDLRSTAKINYISLEQIFHQRRHVNGQHLYEKVINITYYHGNENQTTMRYHLIPVWNGYYLQKS
jgi:hypothetical protein